MSTPASPHKNLPIEQFATRAAFERWLARHGDRSTGAWLKFAKKVSGAVTISKPDAIEAAIAYGWIDGQIDRFDESYWLVRFTPRGRTSRWSQINRKTAERLIEANAMKPPGLAAIESARTDGRWDAAYASQSAAEVPDDFATALARNRAAKAFFATISAANRYAILYRIHHARGPATRAAKIADFVAMLARHETFHPATRAR
jgi:uncharacterized protein YdeI (YjbR/CyaY-like superfamily)